MTNSGPSVYASNPGAPRPRRRLALAAAAALAVFGLGLLIGALAFRTTGRSSSPTTATTSSGRAGAGPTTVVNGVPVGYARRRPGAVAAATEYVTLLSGSAVLENAKIQAILEQIVAPKALPELRSGYRSVTQLVRRKLGLGTKSGPTVVFRSSAVGYRIDSYTNSRSSIAVWAVSVAGSSATATPQQSWSTTVVRLRWTGGDWKVESLKTASGPTPPINATPTPAPGLFTVIPQFEEYRYGQRP